MDKHVTIGVVSIDEQDMADVLVAGITEEVQETALPASSFPNSSVEVGEIYRGHISNGEIKVDAIFG